MVIWKRLRNYRSISHRVPILLVRTLDPDQSESVLTVLVSAIKCLNIVSLNLVSLKILSAVAGFPYALLPNCKIDSEFVMMGTIPLLSPFMY